MPDYSVERMVSTRKLKKFEEREKCIYAECGVSVKQLAQYCVEHGIKGYEGLVDLPGTVAASVYGNASCYGCSIAKNLIEAEVLEPAGNIVKLTNDDLKFQKRSSAFKRGERKGIILSVLLSKEYGDEAQIKHQAEKNHKTRKETQPGPRNSLGSIFANSGKRTILNLILSMVCKAYGILLRLIGNKQEVIKKRKKKLLFTLLGASDVEPYVLSWNWYQWQDEYSHVAFWKYVRQHKRMFTKSEFEIEIKQNIINSKIP